MATISHSVFMSQCIIPGCCCFACRVALDGAEHIVMEGAKHVPLESKPDKGIHWYGSGPYLEEWINVLHPDGKEAAFTASSSSTAGSTASSSS